VALGRGGQASGQRPAGREVHLGAMLATSGRRDEEERRGSLGFLRGPWR